jgi:hypothetical protein
VVACGLMLVSLLLHSCASGDGQTKDQDAGLDSGWGYGGSGWGSGDVNCGNGFIEGSEQCDNLNLGGETCASLGHGSGTLSCDSFCQFDVNMCTNQPGTGGYGG